MDYDKYKNVSTASIIRGTQQLVESILEAKEKGLTKTVDFKRSLANYNEVSGEARKRLSLIDRMSVDFFPDGIKVEYKNRKLLPEVTLEMEFNVRDLGPPTRTGVVVGRTEKNLIVQLDGDDYRIEVEPAKLKIMFLRMSL